MDNIVINFASDTTSLQEVIDALQEIIKKNGDLGVTWAKTSAQIEANNKINTTGTTTLGKSIESLANATKTLDKSIIGGAYKEYLKQIQAQLGLTSKELVSYIQNARQAAQAGVINAGSDEEAAQLTLSIEVMNEKLKELGVSEDSVGNKTLSLKSQLMAMRNELGNMEQGTPEFKKLFDEAGQLDDKIRDLNASIKNVGSDTRNIDGLIGLASGVAGGFAVAQGAAALFGAENEEVQKALLKVNAAMAILQGLQQLGNVLQKESAASIFLTNLFRKQSTVATIEGAAATAADVVATEADTAAKIEQTVAIEATTVATKGLSLALLSNPVTAVLVGVLALVSAISVLSDRSVAAAANQETLNKAIEETGRIADDDNAIFARQTEQILANAKLQGASQIELAAIEGNRGNENIKNLAKRRDLATKVLNEEIANENFLMAFGEDIDDKTIEARKKLNDNLIGLEKQLTAAKHEEKLKQIAFDIQKDNEEFVRFSAVQDAKVAQTIAGSDAEKNASVAAIRAKAKAREETIEFKALKPEQQDLIRVQEEKNIQGLLLQNYGHYLKGRSALEESFVAESRLRLLRNKVDTIEEIDAVTNAEIAALKRRRDEALKSDPNLNSGERQKIIDDANLAIEEAEKARDLKTLARKKDLIAQELALTIKGSQEEHDFKIEQINIEEKIALEAVELTQQQVDFIKRNSDKKRLETDRARNEAILQNEINLDTAALDQFGKTENEKLALTLKRLEEERSKQLSQATDKDPSEQVKINADIDRQIREAKIASIDAITKKQVDALNAYEHLAISTNERIIASESTNANQKINALADLQLIKNAELQLEANALKQKLDINLANALLTNEQRIAINEQYNVDYQTILNKQVDIATATAKAITDIELKEADKRIAKIKEVFGILQSALSRILPVNAFSAALSELQNFAVNAFAIFDKLKVKKKELDEALAKAVQPGATSADIADATVKAKDFEGQSEEDKQKLIIAAVVAGQAIINQIYADSAARRQEELDAQISAIEDQKAKELSNTKLTAQQKADVEARYREKERQVKIKAFNVDKQAKATQALINGLLGATAALASFPPNPFLAALAVANSIIAAAQIAAQPTPRFKQGKIDIQGPVTMANGEIPAIIHKGESVINEEGTQKWKKALVAINTNTFEGYLSMKFKEFRFPELPELAPHITHNHYYNNNIQIDWDKAGHAIARHLPNVPEPVNVELSVDEDGFKKLVEKNGSKTEYKNKRYSMRT